jgi:tetratricopeptide (TPR) repeat protein
MNQWLMLAAAVGCLGSAGLEPALAQSEPLQPLMEESGRIEPAEDTYRFMGTANQRITIILESEDFDPVLMLKDSQGNRLASNDDFGGSLNSTVIVALPTDGEYEVVATSFDGQGGDYKLVVRPANRYETLYGEGQDLAAAARYEDAIASYSAAIELAPEEIPAYLGRVEAYLEQVYAEEGNIETPQEIPADAKAAIIADFEKAADLIEASGNPGWAESLREQVEILRGESGGSTLLETSRIFEFPSGLTWALWE